MIQTILNDERLTALFQTKPSVREIEALIVMAKESIARVRLIEINVPLALHAENASWLKLLRKSWQQITGTKWILNLEPSPLHADERVARMRSGLGT